MRAKRLLAAFLLGVGLCFVPGAGHGEVWTPVDEREMEIDFLRARIDYMMQNPTNFLDVRIGYDEDGKLREIIGLPLEVSTRGKIYISITDTRGIFHDKSEIALLMEFRKQLEVIFSLINYGIIPLTIP